MKTRFVMSIFILLMAGYMLLGGAGIFQTTDRMFQESKAFPTYQEAIIYQNEVITEAQRLGADVNEFTITITSPPTISFTVTMPFISNWDTSDITPCTYGERVRTTNSVRVNLIICSIFGVLTVIGIIGANIYVSRKESAV